MRRKSERAAATKKTKNSPEKKVEKMKRGRTRRSKKQSTSSENESGEENSPVKETETVAVETKPSQTPIKEDSPEEAQDQVWHVKTAEVSGDTGEIQKLKICLTRPPSTPERVDRSPRSRKKLTRATSSSDTASVDLAEDKKKSKHRSRRSTRESKDGSEKNHDDFGDDPEIESEVQSTKQKSDNETIHTTEAQEGNIPDDTPMSTTNDESKGSKETERPTEAIDSKGVSPNTTEVNVEDELQGKSSDADTTVASPKPEIQENTSETTIQRGSSIRERSESIENSEVLEIHAEDKKDESSDTNISEVQNEDTKEEMDASQEKETSEKEVSKTEGKSDNNMSEETKSPQNESIKAINIPDVVESSEYIEKEVVVESNTNCIKGMNMEDSNDYQRSRELERSDSTQSTQEESVPNGPVAPIVINRKRRWGTRAHKIATQKSITISTDILKDIIPDVKPVEFDEVIEEKKHHKRVEVTEKIDRPVLPKIIIDNTEQVERHRKEVEDNEKEVVRPRESQLSSSRKISIINDNDSIIARPPSPPRHKQSCILYITNLVRPFTLALLKNLLQRTGRIVEDEFWIDKIKSKCYVKYETEDQAVETRHALHGVRWPVSNPKTLHVDFATQEAFDRAKANEDSDNAQVTTIPGTVEDWLREQDLKRERGELDKPWDRKTTVREWDMGKGEKDKDRQRRDDRPLEKRRHRTPERSPEPAKKFKKKEEEAPAKLLDDLFRKTKTTPCIYWLPLSAETIAIKEEQRRQHMAEHERRLQEMRRTHRRH